MCSRENDGLFHIDVNGHVLNHYLSRRTNESSILSNSIWSLYLDRNKRIWLGYYNAGIGVYDQLYDKFEEIESLGDNLNSLKNTAVTAIVEDNYDKLWIAMDGGGIDVFDSKLNKSTHISSSENKTYSGLTNDYIVSLFVDSKQNIWAGSWANGLFFLKNGSKNFVKYTTKNSNLKSNNILSIAEELDGTIWFASWGKGLHSYNPQSQKITYHNSEPFLKKGITNSFGRKVLIAKNGDLWLTTTNKGLFKIKKSKENTFSIVSMASKMYEASDSDVSTNHVLSLFESSDGSLWIGTRGSGLCKYNLETDSFRWYDERNGLEAINVLGIIEDLKGNIWLSSNSGISKFDINNNTFTRFTKNDGLLSNDFYINSTYRDSQGILYFGNYKGINYFNPSKISTNNIESSLYLTGFKLFNRLVTLNEKDTPLQNVIGGGVFERTGKSVFARLSYDYQGKYLIEGSLRYDTSSFFPTDKKSGYFPAISAGWILSKENFWKEDSKINYAKLRASWGQNGSDNNLGTYISSLIFQTVAQEAGVVPVTYQGLTGITPGNLPNLDLGWERSEQLDLGLDFRAFDNRLNFSADYYVKTTRDLLIVNGNIIAPPSLGVGVPSINAGTVENKGFEFEIGYNDTTDSGFSYGINLNLSTLKNEVTEINFVGEKGFIQGAGAPQNNDGITRFKKGSPLWYFHGYKTDGVDPATGELIIVDTDGVAGITSNDKTEIGSPHPDILYGGSLDFGYKGLDLSIRFQGTQGNDIFAAYHQPSRPITNKPVEFFTGRWQKAGDIASYPSAANANSTYDTDLMVQDGSYMRIKQIQLGYNFPTNVAEKIKLKKLRTYISLDDYFTFTKYNGLDPEAGSFSDNSIGVDRGFYPIPSKLLLGLSLEF